jgi:hypothetical protein
MAGGFHLWAHPWWVNLLLFAPVLSFACWRRAGLALGWRQLLYLAAFGVSFGFVEAVVVVYLRAGMALAGGQSVSQLPADGYQQVLASLALFPSRLLAVEICREAATMIMLISVALLTAPKAKERWACFLWVFAAWDLTYYVGLRATLGWPSSLLDFDLLFLIPVPWVSQVWFPVLVSTLALAVVALSTVTTRPVRLKQPASPPATPRPAAPKQVLPGSAPGAND